MWKHVTLSNRKVLPYRLLGRIDPLNPNRYEYLGAYIPNIKKNNIVQTPIGLIQCWTLFAIKKPFLADQLSMELLKFGYNSIPEIDFNYVDFRKGIINMKFNKNEKRRYNKGVIIALSEEELNSLSIAMQTNIWHVSGYRMYISRDNNYGNITFQGHIEIKHIPLNDIITTLNLNFKSTL